MGDDLNDLVIKKSVGIFVAPNDAVKPVKDAANIILSSIGGNGAIREIADIILEERNLYRNIQKKDGLRKIKNQKICSSPIQVVLLYQ